MRLDRCSHTKDNTMYGLYSNYISYVTACHLFIRTVLFAALTAVTKQNLFGGDFSWDTVKKQSLGTYKCIIALI